jgi:uncharacterized protein
MVTEQQFIDPSRLDSKGTVFTGALRPGDLENLADDLATPEGELRYRVTARLEDSRRRTVSCTIDGFVFLTCQSTFETFRHEVALEDRLVLVGSEEELPPFEEEGDREDYVVATAPIDVRGLVEEAVILSLPMVPRKPGAGPAAPEGGAKSGGPKPFEALAGLKRPKSD